MYKGLKQISALILLLGTNHVLLASERVKNAEPPPPQASASRWNFQPWLDDLHQIKQALDTKYANLKWLTETRQVNLDTLFLSTESGLKAAGSDAAARAVLESLISRINDGHVYLDWPQTNTPPTITSL